MRPRRKDKTILVVDDEDSLRTLICTVLRSDGYRVLEAGSSEAASQIVDRHRGKIHLLLTDVVLPGQNGCDLAAEVNRTYPTVPVVLMSGLPGAEVAAMGGNSSEPARFLQKPFKIADLLSRISQFLESPERTPQSAPA